MLRVEAVESRLSVEPRGILVGGPGGARPRVCIDLSRRRRRHLGLLVGGFFDGA